jgi:hypothetical protein
MILRGSRVEANPENSPMEGFVNSDLSKSIILSESEWKVLEETLASPVTPNQELTELLKLTRKNQE